MDQGALVMPQLDAGARLVNEFDKYAPVRAAFWLKPRDEGEWYLYLASDQIDDSNFDVAYGEVLRLTGKTPTPWLDPLQVKVISADAPLAKAVLAILARYPGKVPTRYQGRELGGVPVEEVYIYPTPAPLPV
jgi:hypothetical protein